MRAMDILQTAQTNMLHAKLRSSLTVIAVFIGALTISLTNGVGNGVKSYVNKQLGNVGIKDTLIVQAKQDRGAAFTGDIKEYNPDKQVGQFNIILMSSTDSTKMKTFTGVKDVTPQLVVQVAYITAGDKKFEMTANQYVDGLNLELAAGQLLGSGSKDGILLPVAYVTPLGFASAGEAVGKKVTLGFTNALGKIVETEATVVGVQQKSLLSAGGVSISRTLAATINAQQGGAQPQMKDKYLAFTVTYDPSFSTKQVTALKKQFDAAGYKAQTIEDQLGTVNSIINSILIALNLFGAIALLAASFGIVNTLLMAVNERTREIGLMKALGAHRRNIFAIFALEAVGIGFWGALLGVLVSMGIGTAFSNYASSAFLKDFVGFKLLTFPLLPSVEIMLLIMGIAFVAGALPSLKASRLDPIDALRYE